ncbi:mucin-22-like [Ptychodera flava]|uniref:mucin-22-like n=1 Tax=Ptychodera flava TaxID=63121 RepID=UPI00396A6894
MKTLVVCFLFLAFVCAVDGGEIDIKGDSFEITSPSGSLTFNRNTDTALTFDVGLENDDSTAVTLTSVKLYLSDNSDVTAAGAIVSTAIDITGAPTTVDGDADGSAGNGLTTGMTAAVKIADGTDCSSYTKICLRVIPDDGTECKSATMNCDALAFKVDTIAVTAPTTYTLNRVQATTLTFSAGLFNADATETTITSYKLYLSDNEDLSDGATKKSAAIDVTGAPTTVPASSDGTAGKGLTTGMTSAVKIESAEDCSAYNKLCLKVEYDSTSATGCFDVTGKTDCASTLAFKTGSFSITGPSTYKLNTDTETTLTFSAALLNVETTEVTLTSYKLYLSDNVDLSATGANVSDAINVTGAPTTVPASADGTADKGLTTGMTSAVKIESAEDCSAYKWACLKAEPGPVTDCTDVSDKIECANGGATVTNVSLFTAVLILTSTFSQFQQ